MKGGIQRKQFRPGLALQLHRESYRKVVKKVNRQAYKEAVARHKRMNPERTFFGNILNKFKSLLGGIGGFFGKLFGRNRAPRFKKIVFRQHTPRILTDEERADRIAHRKQIRHNRQRLINKRGYA